jgi:hypothetical protein
MRDGETAHRLRHGIAPGNLTDIVQVVNTDLPEMTPSSSRNARKAAGTMSTRGPSVAAGRLILAPPRLVSASAAASPAGPASRIAVSPDVRAILVMAAVEWRRSVDRRWGRK